MLARLCAALAALLLLCSVAHALCAPGPVPAPAAARGLTCKIFWDDFRSPSTVDLADTRASGFKWYLDWAHTNPADIAFVAGGMQLTPSSNTSNDLFNISSCSGPGGSYQYVGNAVGGSMYINVTISSIGTAGPGAMWWPAVWALGVQQIYRPDPPPTPFNSPEVDFIEHTGGARNLHQWFIYTGGQTETWTPYANTPPFLGGETLGTLILKPEQNGGVGTVVGYLNDIVEAESTPATWTPGGTYSVTAEMPMCFLITSGYQQPLVLRSFEVFVPPPPPGIGRPRKGLR
jgi:hypothetical protein